MSKAWTERGYQNLYIQVTDAERQEIRDWAKQNPHLKMGRTFGDVLLAFVRGRIPKSMTERERAQKREEIKTQ